MTQDEYKIEQIDYHYYHELSDRLTEISILWDVIQIIQISPSGDNLKMHRATVLIKSKLVTCMSKDVLGLVRNKRGGTNES